MTEFEMTWVKAHRSDPEARVLADRHYNRQKPGTPGFVPPGRCLVFKSICRRAFWVTSWPFAEYVRHAWGGAWVNSAFRNEGAGLSSLLIRDAVAATRYVWAPPEKGLVTFVDARKTLKKDKPGWCYRKAGFKHVGMTKGGLWVMQLLPADMPEAKPLGEDPLS
jgi:hypothetical protein